MNKEMERWKNRAGLTFLKKVGIKLGDSVLDFGSRYGTYTIPAAKIVGENGIVYALDKSEERLGELMKSAEAEDLQNIKKIHTNGELKIPLRDETVDAVLLYDVVHLVGKNDSSTVNDRMILYKEVYRIAKNNALISVYPTHLATHTDITSNEEIRRELKEEGFKFERGEYVRLIHDENFVSGSVLNFRK